MNNNSTISLLPDWTKAVGAISAPFLAGATTYNIVPDQFKMAAAIVTTLAVGAGETAYYLASSFGKALQELGNKDGDSPNYASASMPHRTGPA